MKRLGTIVADLRYAAADLEMQSAAAARRGQHAKANQLRAAASDALAAANRAENAL